MRLIPSTSQGQLKLRWASMAALTISSICLFFSLISVSSVSSVAMFPLPAVETTR